MVNKYVITGAQYGANVNKQFLASVEKYCRVNNAELIIMPMKGKHPDDDGILHPDIAQYKTVNREMSINKNIKLKNFNVRPNQIEPTTGLLRLAQGDKTTIFPSPKQRMRVVPNSNTDLPKMIISTGAITLPYYDRKYKINRVAEHDHVYGMAVVERVNGTHYHVRQVQALKNGKFNDLGYEYSGNKKPVFKGVEALVLGDLHGIVIDRKAHKANLKQIKEFQPSYVVIHDLFDGSSINHWEENKEFTKQSTWRAYGLSLEAELKATGKILKDYADASTNVIVVRSNHDERIDRWLNESRYVKEPQNNLLGHELYLALADGQNPLQYGLAMFGHDYDNVTFLRRGDELKVRGFSLDGHGDEGANGGRGSMRSKEYAHGKSITAHSHTPQILRNTYVVGTSTPLKLPYTLGFSSWLQTNALLSDLGKVQLVNTIKGKYKL